MTRNGPALESLLRRLADTPPDFLDEPRIGSTGRMAVAALVNDLLSMHGTRAAVNTLREFEGRDARSDRNRLALVMIGCWLLADEWFLAAGIPQGPLLQLLRVTLAELATAAPAHKYITDAERREELARVALGCLGYRPEAESEAQASDRLASISGLERRRLLEASRAAERRAREIREALAKKAAEESADKWTRE